MNLTDLREVLRDRAELADSSHEARMAGVRARVTAAKQRRAVAGAAFVVLALVGIVYALLPRLDQPEPAVPPRSLPEYQFGTRLLTQAWGDLPSTSATVRFVPRSLDLMLFIKCDTGPTDKLLISITVNGHPFAENRTCGGASSANWSNLGVVVGQQSVITLTVDGKEGSGTSNPPPVLPSPESGSFALGVGEAVPVSEYPFPPRPQTLETFPPSLGEPAIEVRSDAADPAGRKEITAAWPGDNELHAEMNTPGRMRILVNDVEVINYSHWTYGLGSSHTLPGNWPRRGLQLTKGQQVKITVIPERTTGEWRVTLTPRR
ncbi:hypothetical protein SAMN04488564_101935 [Lentzea waywayandensis]|uniref:Uncharacterized protein n=1 Tax=Lentzea waywayandensis TaxID=84724 RepID=A0A1I6D397_9PSEU|nr:hypothetical protein [Lentzea waywayandensis]SFQ99821.1 hypothetical protein SAMN04488564_101935 [Lentzea waywayandensis]